MISDPPINSPFMKICGNVGQLLRETISYYYSMLTRTLLLQSTISLAYIDRSIILRYAYLNDFTAFLSSASSKILLALKGTSTNLNTSEFWRKMACNGKVVQEFISSD